MDPDVVTHRVTVKNGDAEYRTKDVADGDIYVLPVKPDGTPEFKGWRAEGSTTLLQPGEDLKITADTVIHAVRAVKCTVSFDLADETLPKIDDVTVEKGETIKKPVVPSREGYTFSGWRLNNTYFSFNTPITESITLSAVWTANGCTVSFDLGDDSLKKIDDACVDYGKTVSEPGSSVIPDRTGYAFAGWYLNEEKYLFSTPVTRDITLKAHWTTDYCIVSFDTGGGTGMSSLKIPYGEKINIEGAPVNPVREGYVFDGWTMEDGSTFSFDMAITGDTKLTADWTEKCTVSFDTAGGTETASQYVEKGSCASSPSVVPESPSPYKVFDFWSADGTTEFDFTGTAVTEDITIKAVWKDRYKVGDTGPAGGIIIYDCDADNTESDLDGPDNLASISCRWRYIEAAPDKLSSNYVFGDYRKSSSSSNMTVGTFTDIGKGKENTEKLVSAMGGTAYTKDTGSEKGAYAALACYNYSRTYGGVLYDDWFLPSRDELVAMGKIIREIFNFYWSSSEDGEENAWHSPLGDDSLLKSYGRTASASVRPARYF